MNKIITPDGIVFNLGIWRIEECEIIYDDQQSVDELREENLKSKLKELGIELGII